MDERFELIIDVKSRGIDATESQIKSATEALDSLSREGKLTEAQVDSLSKTFRNMERNLQNGITDLKQYERTLREVRKESQSISKSNSDSPFDALKSKSFQNALKANQAQDSFMSSLQARSMQAEFKAIQEADRVSAREKERLEKATLKAAAANDKLSFSSPSLRYALYDVATTATIAATAITGVGVAAAAASASYERAFANVERTLQPGTYGVEQLRGELLQLSREIPLTFGNISEIATLGNQLGLSGEQVAGFTETVAQFSAVAGTTVQETSLAFGQLDNLLPDVNGQFDRLGSSIALVGVNSAATETQIIAVAREIAPAAAAAGFAASEVIGLSGALSSLKVPPERSRSTILQFFETLNMATAEGGDKLENFARVVGVSASELESMVRSGQGRSILERFIGNVSTSDSVAITQALDELGLAGLRTNPTIRALAGNMQLLNSTFADGARGWQENSELARQYEIIVQTLSAQWQIFLNALMEFGAAVGNAVAPALKVLLDISTDVLNNLSDFASTPFGETIIRMVALVAALVAALAGVVGIAATAGASLAALNFALSQPAIAAAAGNFWNIAKALVGVSGASAAATAWTQALRTALISTGIGAFVVAVGIAITALSDLEGTFLNLLQPVHFAIDAMANFAQAVVAVGGAIAQGTSAIPLIGGAFQDVARMAQGAAHAIEIYRTTGHVLMDLGAANLRAKRGTESFTDAQSGAMDAVDAVNSLLGGNSKGLDKVGSSAGGAAKQVRTLVDYANDLQSVWSRAFEIRFNSQSTLDTVRSSFISIQEATEASARAIATLKAEISGFQSDLNTQQYFLGIALEYKDYARAEAIQANIAKLQADLADKQAALTEEQSKNSKALTGNSKAAIANRKTITDLVSQYQAHLQALAASGLSQDQLAVATEQLRQDFLSQATQLGYNRAELDMYARAFDDVRVAVDKVPRNITVTANVDPAIQALNELEAKARTTSAALGGMGGGIGGANDQIDASLKKRARLLEYMGLLGESTALALKSAADGNLVALSYWRLMSTFYSRQIASGSYAGGGYTGAGGRLEPAGVVHRGEYVIPKRDVNQRTGLPYADALGRLQKGTPGRRGYSGGGYVNPGNSAPQFMYLAPASIQQLAMAMEKYIVVDNRVLAETTSSSYATGTSRGDF